MQKESEANRLSALPTEANRLSHVCLGQTAPFRFAKQGALPSKKKGLPEQSVREQKSHIGK